MKPTNPCPDADTVRDRLRRWYQQPLGRFLGQREQDLLEQCLSNVFGYHILQVGSLGWGCELLAVSRIRHQMLLDADSSSNDNQVGVYACPAALPIASDSIDAVVLAHTLEFEKDPHQVLREAERILIPQGRILILTFNPWSLWGLWRLLLRRGAAVPWCGRFLSQVRLRDWLALLGFKIEATHGLVYRPPLQNRAIMARLGFVEDLGRRWWPFLSAVNLTVAEKRVSTLTPIRPRWRPRRSLGTAGLAEPSARRVYRD